LHQIASDLDVDKRWRLSQQLAVLRSGALVDSRHESKQHSYGLTDAGLAMVQVLRSTCSRLAPSQGGLILLPEPITPGVGDALDPTSPDGLATLLKTFADPLRLRLLNLLAVRVRVCICHLHEALAQPRWSVLQSLAHPKALGLVLEEEAESWPCYRLARPARDLHHSLLGCFGSRLADAETFRNDQQRLGLLAPCPLPMAEDEAPGTRQVGTRTRTA
jgi:ArsR family transcriptional regulator, arsenate/arsenite/antimonite-responsive transcriptional repressor